VHTVALSKSLFREISTDMFPCTPFLKAVLDLKDMSFNTMVSKRYSHRTNTKINARLFSVMGSKRCGKTMPDAEVSWNHAVCKIPEMISCWAYPLSAVASCLRVLGQNGRKHQRVEYLVMKGTIRNQHRR